MKLLIPALVKYLYYLWNFNTSTGQVLVFFVKLIAPSLVKYCYSVCLWPLPSVLPGVICVPVISVCLAARSRSSNVHCISAHCTLNTAHYTLHTSHTLHIEQSKQYTVNCTNTHLTLDPSNGTLNTAQEDGFVCLASVTATVYSEGWRQNKWVCAFGG